jgi:hypothetical protein
MARTIRMSGSGSASFALYAKESDRDGDLERVGAALAELPGARYWPFGLVEHGARLERRVRRARRMRL